MKSPSRFALAALLAAAVSAQEPESPAKPVWEVGGALGMVGASGFSVKRWLGEKNALQLNFIPGYKEEKYPRDNDSRYPTRDSGWANKGFINLGALYQRYLRDDNTGFLVYAGAGCVLVFDNANYHTTRSQYTDSGYVDATGRVTRNADRAHLSAGTGFGRTFTLWRLQWTTMVGVRGGYDFSNRTKELGPAIDASVHYRL